jgi:GTP diphosphokinase / guanosine-3',5'-bis(diphosphate) 3'-diphosphatase
MSLTKEEKIWIEEQLDVILGACQRCKDEEDKDLIRKAFHLANKAHSKMRRKSGEPYFTHPIAVAIIVAEEIGLGPKAVASALLHDVVEDTDYTLEDIERLFGSTIANIVNGLTKISHVLDKDASLQVENFRKMLLTLSEDVRVIFVKLADRLHNMRTLDSMPEFKQIKITGETTYLYAPLAHRLGLYTIKTELEDLALKYEHPIIYREISRKITESADEREEYIKKIIEPLQNKLDSNGIECTITGRPKSIYSIWNKMQQKNVPFEEIYDLFAIRIIFKSDNYELEKQQAYKIFAIITSIYVHHGERIRDWITTPKANGYEALHVTVMGPYGKWIEIQIRSERMDDIAERGYAAHWKYKDSSGDDTSNLDTWLQTIREQINDSSIDALDFLDEFKMNLFSAEVYLFTPKGQLIRLPKGATVIDFAYEIHTEVGDRAIAAKVNYKLVALSHVLETGDQVEIITSDKHSPKQEWLNFATTSKAKSKIKSALKEERRYVVNKGQQLFIAKVKELGLTVNHKKLKDLREKYDCSTKEDFYRKIGLGLLQLDDLDLMLDKKDQSTFRKYWTLEFIKMPKMFGGKKINKNETFMIKNSPDKEEYTLAGCCNPIPGDEVIGYINSNNSIIIHRKNCNVLNIAAAKQGDRIITVKWNLKKKRSFVAHVAVEGFDKLGLVFNITKVIYQEANVNMKAINFQTHDGIFKGELQLFVHDTNDLDELLKKILRISGVKTVVRLEDGRKK